MPPTTAMVTHTHRLPLKNWAIKSMTCLTWTWTWLAAR
jgi:hypothetical protein